MKIPKIEIKKIDLYITKKFLGTFLYAILLIISITIVFDISEKIDDFLGKHAPLSEIIFSYYLNFIPYFVNLFSPLFTFIAVIFFTSKMASNTEIIAILSSGVSFRRLLRPYLVSSLILALLSFALSNFIIPPANEKRQTFENIYIKNPRHYIERNWHFQISPGNYVYMESFNPQNNTGYQFTLEKTKDSKMYYKMKAEKISWDSIKQSWLIENFSVRTFDKTNEKLTYGSKLDTVFRLSPKDFERKVTDVETMNFFQLRKFIDEEEMKGSENIKFYIVEKHKRIAFPFATVVLTLIGVSLSSRKLRGGIGGHLGIGIGISFTFLLFMQITTVFSTNGNLPAFIACWIPNILFGILGLYLLKTAPK